MAYTDASIDRVREADIVKTIGHYVSDLKKKGANYFCKSPFTNERSASFSVSPEKQMFKCFSSGIGGDAIKFVMEQQSLEFIEAIEAIAKVHSIFLEKETVTPEVQRQRDARAEMFGLLDKVSNKFVASRKQLPKEHWINDILEERKFTDDAIVSYMLGYAPNANQLYKWAAENGTLAIAKELGLCGSKENSGYDVFKNRLIFPIHNHKGAVVGFGGRRSNNEADTNYAKYINSKESPIYKKSNVLYGLWQAKRAISKTGTAILTEGYTDVIGMVQHGCENTIASCGTALTDNHAQLIKKYGQEIILLRDGDEAGHKATIRDIDICLANGLQVSLCVLPEGEDPDSFARQQGEAMIYWINANKRDALLWKVEQYDIKRDKFQRDVDDINDEAERNIEDAKAKMHTDDHLKELSGEALKEAKSHNANYRELIATIRKQAKQDIKDIPEIDSNKKALAVDDICKTLFSVKHEVKRGEYIKQISKLFNVTTGTLKTEIGNLEKKATEQRQNKIGIENTANLRLPKGADKEEYLQHGFVTVGNSYHFQRTNGGFFQGTNFKLQPLFHIQGDKENKRLCEITNHKSKKKLIDFDSDMLANFSEFRRYLFRIGGFMFLTHEGVRTEHFDKFVYRYEEEFQPALELLTMGWNRKGFFAFADGVYWQGKFRKVNKYGIIHLEGIDTERNEYKDLIDYWYSPAFSVMHNDNQDGDDKYENDRYFVYKEANVKINDWIQQMHSVFNDKGIVGVLFNFAACFRDLFLSNYDYFPLLGGFGEKDSGKSAFGKILQNFFYYRLPALDLTQATHVGFSRRLSRNVNTVQFLDEYQDKQCDDKIFSGMMGGWNGIGREKGMNTADKRTQYDKINSAIYYCGQFMPTRMENALATRTVSLLFQNKNYSVDQKTEFNKILDWTNEGLSSLVVDVVQHRAYFENNLPAVHAESVRTLKSNLKDSEYQERIFGNVAMLFTTYNILKDKINFPFSSEEVEELLSKLIVDNSEQIADSNGLTEFWSIIQFLFEHGIVSDERDFKISKKPEFKILTGNKTWEKHNNNLGKNILFLRLKSVYQHYNKEVTKREGVEVIGQTTIRQYFKSRSYFIGLVKSERFGEAGPQSCYAFDYEAMKDQGLITLIKDSMPEIPLGQTGNVPKDENDIDF
ncbi:DNA primase [Winogradskyella sp.]|uniref:DNA primase n=1 Tax=Winogradskyella sp. TaxID=1883156 RepID=UPI003BAC4F8F